MLGARAAQVLRYPRRDEVALAEEALQRLGDLYAVEESIRGQPAEARRRVRQARAGPKLAELRAWFVATLKKVPKKSAIAGAIRYALSRWEALVRYRDDWRIEIDNNAVERALRAVALGRKNYLFADLTLAVSVRRPSTLSLGRRS